MTALFVLDVPENEGVLRVAEQDPLLVLDKIGPYYRISGTTDEVLLDRRATGSRHAVWYSAIAGLQDAHIAQHDKDVLRIVSSHRCDAE